MASVSMNSENWKIIIKQTLYNAWKQILPLVRVMGIMLGWWMGLLTINWMLARAYSNCCVPSGIWGLLTSAFTAHSPICQLLYETQRVTMDSYVMFIGMVFHVFASQFNKAHGISQEVDI